MAAQPHIIVSETDLDRLERLLESLPGTGVPGLADLEEELGRAEILPSADIPPSVVTMNSTVCFSESTSSREYEVTLVYPKDLTEDGTTISVLAPVGSALLGLSEGDGIEWPRPGGGTLKLRIERVVYQPERAGEYHR